MFKGIATWWRERNTPEYRKRKEQEKKHKKIDRYLEEVEREAGYWARYREKVRLVLTGEDSRPMLG